MPYLQPFLRTVFSGVHFTNDRFSFGMTWINDFGTGTAPTEVPQALIDAATAFFTAGPISTSSKLDTIKVNLIGTDGRYVNDTTVLHEYTTPVGGTGAANAPPQVALAVSLDTGKKRGLAARGRFYLPSLTYDVDQTGRISTANVSTLLNVVGTFLDGLDASLPGWDLGVVSNVGSGAQSAVTSIRIGRVYDTIRSRRAQLDEDYTADRPITEQESGG